MCFDIFKTYVYAYDMPCMYVCVCMYVCMCMHGMHIWVCVCVCVCLSECVYLTLSVCVKY